MDVYQCLRSRRTVREYKPDPIPQELVRKILQAGRWAPSSSNTQKWHFIVVQDRDTLAALGNIATHGPFIGQAPLAIAVVMDDAPRPQLDAGRALQQMELMAWSEGVGMCFVGVREEDQQTGDQEALGYPGNHGTNNAIAVRLPRRRAQRTRDATEAHGRYRPLGAIWREYGSRVGPMPTQFYLRIQFAWLHSSTTAPSINGWSPAHHCS